MSRDRSFTATKNKETRNKILAQENTKDSDMSITPTFGLIISYQPTEMAEPKVGINYVMPEYLVFSYAKTLFLVSLLFVAVKDRSLLTYFLNF